MRYIHIRSPQKFVSQSLMYQSCHVCHRHESRVCICVRIAAEQRYDLRQRSAVRKDKIDVLVSGNHRLILSAWARFVVSSVYEQWYSQLPGDANHFPKLLAIRLPVMGMQKRMNLQASPFDVRLQEPCNVSLQSFRGNPHHRKHLIAIHIDECLDFPNYLGVVLLAHGG